MQEPATTAKTHVDSDELEFDPLPYLFLLWRQRVAIVMVALSCAVLAGGVTLLMPKTYEATARIYMGEPGSGGYPARFARVRMLASDPAVASQMFGDTTLSLASKGVTMPELSSAITIGDASPANAALVSVRLGDPGLASSTAYALSLKIVEVYRAQLATALQAAEAARRAALDFSVAKQIRPRRDAQKLILYYREELAHVLAQIVAQRARLVAAKGNPETLAQIRITQAGLEAQRDYLSGIIAENDSAATLLALTEDDLAQQRLDAGVAAAEQQLLASMGMAAVEVDREGVNRTPPAVLESSAPESRDASPSVVRIMASALVIGLVLAILGVIIRDRLTRLAVHG